MRVHSNLTCPHPSTSSTTCVRADASPGETSSVVTNYAETGHIANTLQVEFAMQCQPQLPRGGHNDIRPFLVQSDSASRKGPFYFSTGLFFDCYLLVLLLIIVSRVGFIVFVIFLQAVGMREYCCTAGEIGWQLCASRFFREQRLDEPSSHRVGGFGLSRKPPKLRSWSCTQPRADKATAGAAVVGSMGSRPRAAAVV